MGSGRKGTGADGRFDSCLTERGSVTRSNIRIFLPALPEANVSALARPRRSHTRAFTASFLAVHARFLGRDIALIPRPSALFPISPPPRPDLVLPIRKARWPHANLRADFSQRSGRRPRVRRPAPILLAWVNLRAACCRGFALSPDFPRRARGLDAASASGNDFEPDWRRW